MKAFCSVALALCVAWAPLKSFSGQPDDTAELPPELKAWVEARAGKSEPVHWVSEGAVYAYPSGEKLFGMIGFDSSRVIWPGDGSNEVIHLTRKTFTYTHPDTGEVLTEYKGKQVTPIAYPYQMIRYRYEDGLIFADVEQGVRPNVQMIKSNDGILVRRLGSNTWAYTASVFLDFPTAGGERYQAWENYDFFIQPENSGVDKTHQMSWQRYGDLPSWAGEGKAIYHLLSWRTDNVEEFPEDLLRWAKKNQPMWLTPPASIEEVRKLQSQSGGTGW